MTPTADHIARAVVAASKELECDPFLIDPARRPRGLEAYNAAARLRSYAALALFEIFPDVGRTGISRCVHAGSPDAFLSTLLRRIRFGECPWFSQAALDRIVASIQEIDPPPPDGPSKPAEGDGEAVELPAFIPPRAPPEAPPGASLARRLGLVSQSAPPGRARAYDILHEAVKNTGAGKEK